MSRRTHESGLGVALPRLSRLPRLPRRPTRYGHALPGQPRHGCAARKISPMDRQTILAVLDRERRLLARDAEVIEVLEDVTRLRASDGSHHAVIFTSLT